MPWIRINKRLSHLVGFAASIFLAASVPLAGAVESSAEKCVRGICFTQQKRIGEQTVGLRGFGVFRYLFLDVYTAGLYGPEEWSEGTFREDESTELVIHYHRSISANQFAEAALDRLKKQHPMLPPSVQRGVEQLHGAYNDVGPGDRYTLRYEPSIGTTLLLNDRSLVSIPGSEFARYYFGIWLDPVRPLDASLRSELVGN